MQKQHTDTSPISPAKDTRFASPRSLEPNEDDIRSYAFHLYQQSGCTPGRDLDNWVEASACLAANIPTPLSGVRLHHYVYGTENAGIDSHSPPATPRAREPQAATAVQEI